MIMESVGKLKQADEQFKGIIFDHDMTIEDWKEYKWLVAEAKDKESNKLSAEYIYIYIDVRFTRQFQGVEDLQKILNIMYSNVDSLFNKQ